MDEDLRFGFVCQGVFRDGSIRRGPNSPLPWVVGLVFRVRPGISTAGRMAQHDNKAAGEQIGLPRVSDSACPGALHPLRRSWGDLSGADGVRVNNAVVLRDSVLLG